MNKFAGMTMNERLYTAGIADKFDAAVRRKDKTVLMELLAQIEIPARQSQETIDLIFGNPAKYGYED